MAPIDQISAAPARVVATVGNAGVFGGAGSAMLGWAAGVDVFALGGLLVGCVGLLINWHHKRALRRFEAERLELERARLELDRAGPCGPG